MLKGRKTDRRRTTVTTIRVSPFRLTVRPSKGGFICDFSGTDANGRKIEIELEFPPWWVREIIDKLDIFVKTRGKP